MKVRRQPEVDKEVEISGLVVVASLFSIALLIVDLTYKNILSMFMWPDRWVGVLWLIMHVIIMLGWFIVIKHSEDPNKTLLRVSLIVAHILAIALTLSHRHGLLR